MGSTRVSPAKWSVSVLAGVFALSGAGLFPNGARAEEAYPNRPIHVVIGFSAGSGADILSRYMAHKLEGLSGQPVILDNKPGASGNIATRYAANAAPDGYTLMFNANSSMVGAKFLFKELAFDTMRDFKPVATFAQIGFLLVVSPKSPLKSVADLTEKLKAKKDNVFGYSNPTGLLSAELYKQLTGAPAKPVSYKTTTDALHDLQDGTLDFMFMDGTFGAGQVRQGQIKALAVITGTRLATLPDVPTMQEAGLAFDFAPWWAVWAPSATPQPILDKLEKWVLQIDEMPETPKFLETIGAVTLHDGQKAAAGRLTAEFRKWPPLVKAAGIQPR
jgi:tripartite-type tricarboxylate transporter receptor subunit TctC